MTIRHQVGVHWRLLCLLICLGCSCSAASLKLSNDTQDDLGGPSDNSGSGADDTDETTDSSDGCGQDPSNLSTTLTVESRSRSFVLYLPSDYDADRTYPLIFAWHGLGGSGAIAQYYFGIEQAAGSDAIIVYPDALPLDATGGDTGWELNPSGYDFAFFDAMYTAVTDGLCIDKSRVFSTGHSFGGYMSNHMGCYRSEVLSAIAPVAGGPPYYGSCTGPVAAWIAHSESDDVVSVSEGTSARDTWRYMNGCATTTTETDPDGCVAYEGCDRDLHWCEYTSGHDWPGFGGTAIWDFFAAQ